MIPSAQKLACIPEDSEHIETGSFAAMRRQATAGLRLVASVRSQAGLWHGTYALEYVTDYERLLRRIPKQCHIDYWIVKRPARNDHRTPLAHVLPGNARVITGTSLTGLKKQLGPGEILLLSQRFTRASWQRNLAPTRFISSADCARYWTLWYWAIPTE